MKKLKYPLAILFCIMGVPLQSSASESVQNSLCVIPVINGQPTEEDANATWRIIGRVISIPSIPYPIIYPGQPTRRGVWTISNQHELVVLNDDPKSFPSNSFWDQYQYDEVTGRTIGNSTSADIYQFNTLTRKFEKRFNALEELQLKTKYTFRSTLIPALNKVIFASDTGLWELTDDKAVPFLPEELQHQLGRVEDIKDMPSFSGMILFTEDSSGFWGKQKKVYFLSYDKKLFTTSIKMKQNKPKYGMERNYFSEAHETYPVHKILITGASSSWFSKEKKAYLLGMNFNPKTGYYPSDSEEIAPFEAEKEHTLPSITTGKYKAFIGEKKIYLFNKEDLPFSSSEEVSFKSIKSRNTFIAIAGNKLYVAENDKFTKPAVDLPPTAFGAYFLYDLPSIHRVLLRAGKDLYELDGDYRLQPITWGDSAHKTISVVEMPKSELAVIVAEEGLFALGKQGLPTEVRNKSTKPQIEFVSSREPTLLQSQELLIGASDQLYLIVDEKISGPQNCAQAAP